MTRIPNPPDDPIVERLRKPNSPDAEDAIALIGFIGPGRNETIRIHPDRQLQRWLEVPGVIDSQRIDPDDELSPSVVWVDRPTMLAPLFTDEEIVAILNQLEPAPMSNWNLIPESRLVAASLLGLIPYDDDEEEGGYW